MISFHHIPGSLQLQEEKIKEWLIACCNQYGHTLGKLSYSFMDNEGIQDLNRIYLKHDYPTDIMSFDYSEGKEIAGEIYLGYEVIKDNVIEFQTSLEDELCRVFIHGLLHLIGFDDHSDTEQKIMRENEDKCLLLRPKNLISK